MGDKMRQNEFIIPLSLSALFWLCLLFFIIKFKIDSILSVILVLFLSFITWILLIIVIAGFIHACMRVSKLDDEDYG